MISALVTILILVNSVRATPLHSDALLNQRAQTRADQLCTSGQWSHDGWLNSFKGISYKYAGENLAKGFATPNDTFAGWLNSPTHLANIVKPKYTKTGLGFSTQCDLYVELFEG